LTVRYQANILYLAKECREQVTFSWDDKHVCPFFFYLNQQTRYIMLTIQSTQLLLFGGETANIYLKLVWISPLSSVLDVRTLAIIQLRKLT
jgi:hypothetical protein